MNLDPMPAIRSRPWTGLYFLIALAALFLARSVLMPVAMAILVTFLLGPAVNRLTRVFRSRAAAVSIVSVLLLGVTASLLFVVWGQMFELADNLPYYRDKITKKIRELQGGTDGVLGRASEAIEKISLEIAGTSAGKAASPSVAPQRAEVQVMGQKNNRLWQLLGAWAPSIAGPLVTALTVVLLSILMLISREDIRDRFIRLAGRGQISLTTQSLEDASQKIKHYLRSQLIINASFGLFTATGLFLIGVPSAVLLGLFAGALRFIPVVGVWIGAVTPILLAFAVFDAWTYVILVGVLFLVAELVASMILEPWLYGSGTGLSSLGVVVALLFWTWIWGPAGLLLSVPLTVCLVVIVKHFPQLEVVETLLGDQPALSSANRLYQRLLCEDEDEAEHVLRTISDAHKEPLALLDEVLFPALQAAKGDLRSGRISQAQASQVCQDLGELATDALSGILKDSKGSTPPVVIACIPSRGICDHVASQLFAQVLEADGLKPRVLSPTTLLGETLELIAQEKIPVLLVSSVQPGGAARTRLVCKAIRQRFPDLIVLVGAWGSERIRVTIDKPEGAEGATAVYQKASDVLRELKALVPSMAAKPGESTAAKAPPGAESLSCRGGIVLPSPAV
jgi:predicted PurR-regulated permease PerM